MLSSRRADVAAFWMVATLLLGAAIGVVALAVGARAPWLWAAAAILAVAPGIVWPAWFTYGVRAWNKAARLCSVALRAYVLRVCYYTFFAGMGPAGSSMDLAFGSGDTSRWVPHGGKQSGAAARSASPEIWSGGLLAAARRPGSRWMLALAPMVVLLRVLGDQHVDSAPASSTYTLY
jgi:hypothetical protein